MNLGESLAQIDSPKMVSGSFINLTMTEQLESKRTDLESRLLEVNNAIDALKKNPELENLLNLIARVRY
jgi:hypothetical protein